PCTPCLTYQSLFRYGQLSTKTLTGIIASLALAAFMMILNETVLTVALPGIMQDMGISASTGQWLTTGFLLTLSVVIPTTGFLLQVRKSTRLNSSHVK